MKLSELHSTPEETLTEQATLQAARDWFNRAAALLDQTDKLVYGKRLSRLLKDGGFPETESRALKAAWETFQREFEELQQSVLIGYQDAEED